MRSSYSVGLYATGEGAFWASSRGYRPDGTIRGCLCFHGASDTALSPHFKPYGNGPSVMQAIADVGFVALSCDNGGAAPWANDTSISRAGDAFTFLTATGSGKPGAKTDKCLVFAASMGAAIALNWAKSNLTKVAAMALCIPAVDMKDIYDNNRGPGLQASIATAYGGDAGWQAAEPTHNPKNFASSFAGIPIRCWYATDDPAIAIATVSTFQGLVGSSCDTVSLGAVGHTPGAIPSADVISFLSQYA